MFELIDYVVKIKASALNIPEFKAIWKRDKGRTKNKAHSELSYVFYMCDYKSEFRNSPENERSEKIIKDFCANALGEDWTPDMKVLEAMKKYEELQMTPSLKFLNFIEEEIYKMREFLNGLGIDEDNIKLKIESMEKISKFILQLPKLKESVRKEVSEKERLTGGGEVGLYED
jgi:hypothetical protein